MPIDKNTALAALSQLKTVGDVYSTLKRADHYEQHLNRTAAKESASAQQDKSYIKVHVFQRGVERAQVKDIPDAKLGKRLKTEVGSDLRGFKIRDFADQRKDPLRVTVIADYNRAATLNDISNVAVTSFRAPNGLFFEGPSEFPERFGYAVRMPDGWVRRIAKVNLERGVKPVGESFLYFSISVKPTGPEVITVFPCGEEYLSSKTPLT